MAQISGQYETALAVGLSYAIDALVYQEPLLREDPSALHLGSFLRAGKKIPGHFQMVRDRFCRFCQDLRLSRDVTETLRRRAFANWPGKIGQIQVDSCVRSRTIEPHAGRGLVLELFEDPSRVDSARALIAWDIEGAWKTDLPVRDLCEASE